MLKYCIRTAKTYLFHIPTKNASGDKVQLMIFKMQFVTEANQDSQNIKFVFLHAKQSGIAKRLLNPPVIITGRAKVILQCGFICFMFGAIHFYIF